MHSLAHEIRIYEEGELLAVLPVLEGRRRTSLLPGHRRSHEPLAFALAMRRAVW
jgi:hypothetical protein